MSNKPDMIKPERYSTLNEVKKQIRATGLDTKDLGAAAFGLGVTLAGLKGIKDTRPKKNLKKGRRTKKKEALKAKYSVKPPVSKPKFSNIAVPVGKPPQTRKPQTLKNVRTESQTFTKKQRPGMDKKETVKVNVVN